MKHCKCNCSFQYFIAVAIVCENVCSSCTHQPIAAVVGPRGRPTQSDAAQDQFSTQPLRWLFVFQGAHLALFKLRQAVHSVVMHGLAHVHPML
eukprot:3743836-Amphidinium_carterae.1